MIIILIVVWMGRGQGLHFWVMAIFTRVVCLVRVGIELKVKDLGLVIHLYYFMWVIFSILYFKFFLIFRYFICFRSKLELIVHKLLLSPRHSLC